MLTFFLIIGAFWYKRLNKLIKYNLIVVFRPLNCNFKYLTQIPWTIYLLTKKPGPGRWNGTAVCNRTLTRKNGKIALENLPAKRTKGHRQNAHGTLSVLHYLSFTSGSSFPLCMCVCAWLGEYNLFDLR